MEFFIIVQVDNRLIFYCQLIDCLLDNFLLMDIISYPYCLLRLFQHICDNFYLAYLLYSF